MAETWVKLLFTYGPFALLILLIFVVERKVWGEVRCPDNKAPVHFVYGATWVAIFLTCGVIVWVWVHNNVSQGYTVIRGSLTGLKTTESLLSRSELMYIRRIYSGNRTSDFAFRIISPKKLTGTTPTTLTIVHDEDNASRFALPIEDSFYAEDSEIALIYDPAKDKLHLQRPDGKLSDLANIDQPTNGEVLPPPEARPGFLAGWWNVTSVFAQKTRPPAPGLLDRLDSVDAILRMDAKAELIKGGQNMAPFAASVLYDPGSTNRQLVATLSALNASSALADAVFKDKFAKVTGCAVKQIAQDGEGNAKSEAAKLAATHPDIGSDKDCTSKAGRTMACKGSRTVRVSKYGGIQRITAGKQHLYLWQPDLSADSNNISTIYVMESELPDLPPSGKLDKNDFRGRMASRLKELSGLRLQPNTYSINKVRNGDTVEVMLSGGATVKIFVRETKYMDDRTDFDVCVP